MGKREKIEKWRALGKKYKGESKAAVFKLLLSSSHKEDEEAMISKVVSWDVLKTNCKIS